MRRSIGIYILLLAILTGLYYYLNNRQPKIDDEVTSATPVPVEYLFSFEDGLPTSIRIESKAGEMVEMARNAENAWALILPIEASADQAAVEAATGQIPTIRVLDQVPNLAKDSVGLDDPEYIITIIFTSGVERIINVGVLTPTESGYYVSHGEGDVLIVGNTGLDGLIGLLTNPPYLPTETPLPATIEAGTSPEQIATPQP